MSKPSSARLRNANGHDCTKCGKEISGKGWALEYKGDPFTVWRCQKCGY